MPGLLLLTLLPLLLALSVSAVPAAGDQSPLVPFDPHTSNSWSWTDCGEGSDVVQIQSLTLSPDPPMPGQNLTVHATGRVNAAIMNGAWADVTVKLGLIKLLSKSFDICAEAENANVSLKCPVEPGDQDVQHTVFLPNGIPPAKFGVQVQAYNFDKAPLLCVNIMIDFLSLLVGRSS